MIHTGDTALLKAITITTPTAASDSTAATAATINSGRRNRDGVMELTLTVRPVPRPKRPKWAGQDNLEGTDQHGPGSHTLNPHINADAVTAGRVADGRKGAQALGLRVLDKTPSIAKAKRPSAKDLAPLVQDLVTVLDNLSGTLSAGKYPEGNKGKAIAVALRKVADELDA